MFRGAYALGLDIGDSAVKAATCLLDSTDAVDPLPVDDETVRPGLADSPIGELRLVSRMGSAAPLCLAGRTVAVADLLAAVVEQVIARATARMGRAPARTVVTVPPSWGAHRRGLLAASLAAAVDGPCALVSGALAAAREHAAAGELPPGAAVLVADLGASTLDTAVVEAGPDGALDHAAVPTAPVGWGGRDADDAVFDELRRCLGDAAAADTDRAAALRRAGVAIKEALSTETVVDVPSTLSGTSMPTRLTREEVEELLAPGVQSVVDAADDAIRAAGRTPASLHAILLTGGAARMPLVAEGLSARFGLPLLVDADPARTAARGAARWGVDGLLAEAAEEPSAAPHGSGRPAPRAARTSLTGPGNGRPSRRREQRRPGARTAIVAGLLLLLLALPWGLLGLVHRSDPPKADGAPLALADTPSSAAGAPSPAQRGAGSAPAARASTSGGQQGTRRGAQTTAAPERQTVQDISSRPAPLGNQSAAAGPAKVATAPTGGTPTATEPAATQSSVPPPELPPTASDPAPVTTTPPDPAPVPTTPPDPAPVTTTQPAGPATSAAADPAVVAEPTP